LKKSQDGGLNPGILAPNSSFRADFEVGMASNRFLPWIDLSGINAQQFPYFFTTQNTISF
jgi:hypothetical protein